MLARALDPYESRTANKKRKELLIDQAPLKTPLRQTNCLACIPPNCGLNNLNFHTPIERRPAIPDKENGKKSCHVEIEGVRNRFGTHGEARRAL
jgi:hypothetical protein